MDYKIIFSPTGGTEKCADILSDVLFQGAETIDLTDAQEDFSRYEFRPEDVVIAAVPSYGGRVPAIAIERLSQLKGNQARAILLCVYGNRAYEDTLVELQDTVEAAGFRICAAVTAVAEHSIVRQIAAGRPDAADAARLSSFANEIAIRLSQETTGAANTVSRLSLPGNHPYKKFGGAGMVPEAGKTCIGCGLCAAECPVQAIPKDDPRKTDGKLCISCMRCLVHCPQSARRVNGGMLTAVSLMLKKACADRKECELF